MTHSSLAILLAAAALVLGLVALAIFYFFVVGQKGGGDNTNTEEASNSSASTSLSSAGRSGPRATRKKKVADRTQRYLFVMFDEPGPDTNQALGQLLKETQAFYETGLGIYHVPPGPEGYPLTVANASSPGTLPPLHQGDDEYPPVQGVSILIKFINNRSLSRSPKTMIAFTRRVAEIGGSILDVERKPVTEETLAALNQDTV